jgi:hypothetical protein
MTQEQINKEIELYKSTGKLSTHPFIYCSKTGTKTTMFGSNLENRIKRFGSLKDLLLKFECRASIKAGKPPKPVHIKKTRKSKKLTTKEQDGKVVYDIPVYNNKPPESIDLVLNPAVCAEVTKNQCWRPDIYLNGSKTCDKCRLYENCASSLKRLSRHYLRS